MSHHDSSLYKLNAGSFHPQETIPLPPKDGMPQEINTYDDVPEPRFNPNVHLNLQMPRFVRLLPTFEKSFALPKPSGAEGSTLAWSSPFQVLSKEGIKVLKAIVERNRHYAIGPETSRGSKDAIRGLYYLSPFVRDFQNCQELKDAFKLITGEELIPHCLLSNVPQVNVSVKNNLNMPTDPWHWDSVAFTGVILLNDMDYFEGGELELMKMEKRKALKELEAGNIRHRIHSEVISYESPGKMILAQGSEVLHHVTPVLNGQNRISMIMAYAPANAYQPPKSILKTMTRVDNKFFLSNYEFFREKAWQTSFALQGYVKNIKFEKDGQKLSPYLRVVAEELIRAADILDEKIDDSITFFDEVSKKISVDHRNCKVDEE